MLRYLVESGRWLAVLSLALWGAISALSMIKGWDEVFGAMGSLLLCVGFAVFLTDRYRFSEIRRLWDNQMEVQLRMLWRYLQRIRHGENEHQPLSLDQIEAKLTESFDAMMAAKNAEQKLETYRIEMVLSIVGTLQWGFGAIIVRLIHG